MICMLSRPGTAASAAPGKASARALCLARSQTCAPFKPLFGCNEILQDNGAG